MKQLACALIIGLTLSLHGIPGQEGRGGLGASGENRRERASRSGADPVRATLGAMAALCCFIPYAAGLRVWDALTQCGGRAHTPNRFRQD